MRPGADHRRSGPLLVLFAVATAAVFGLGACGDGSGEGPTRPSERPTADATRTTPPDETATPTDRPNPSRNTDRPDRTQPPATTEPPAQTQPPQTQPPQTQAPPQTQPPVQTQPPPQQTQPAQPAAPTTTASAPDTAAAAEQETIGDVGCLLLILLVGLVIGGVAIWRSQQKSGWDAEAATLVGSTDATVAQLPSVLTTTTGGQRGLTWPPLRAAFADLIGRWGELASRASIEERRVWAMQIRELIQNLVLAVDAENEAMAFDYDWRLLRPRTVAAEQALTAMITARPAPGTQPGAPVGAQVGAQSGTQSGTQFGTQAGAQAGMRSGTRPGTPGGSQPGVQPGRPPGSPTGPQPGSPAGPQPGSPTGPEQPGSPSRPRHAAPPDDEPDPYDR